MMKRALINAPRLAKKGDVIEIKTLISHPMETGYRHDNEGRPIPRNIIKLFVCTYDGEEIFRADLSQAVSANPYIAFYTVATKTGELSFTWTADDGETQTQSTKIAVT
jgi:sulfur-oxidizing protein SoxZ